MTTKARQLATRRDVPGSRAPEASAAWPPESLGVPAAEAKGHTFAIGGEHPATPPSRSPPMSTRRTYKVILVRPRVYLGEDIGLGPGKIDLIRKVGELKSISAAARALGVPYKRAWSLVDGLNKGFGEPVVATAAGGKGGGGAVLTPLGEQLVARYDDLERRINAVIGPELKALRALVR